MLPLKWLFPLATMSMLTLGVLVGAMGFPRQVILPPVVVEVPTEPRMVLPPGARGFLVWPEEVRPGKFEVNWLGTVDSLSLICRPVECVGDEAEPGTVITVEVRAWEDGRRVFGEALDYTMPGARTVRVVSAGRPRS